MTNISARARSAPGVVPSAAAVIWTLVALVGFAVLPFYSSQSSWSSSDGTSGSTSTQQTIIEHEGGAVVAVLLVPTAIALVGLVGAAFRVPAASIGAAGIALTFCLLGALSIGLFYLPAAILLVVAAVRASSRERAGPNAARASTVRSSLLVAFCLSWAFLGLVVGVSGLAQVNDDAAALVALATVVGVAASLAAARLVVTGHLRWAGIALLVSAVTPTWFAWVLNIPALAVGAGLLGVGKLDGSHAEASTRR